MGLGGKWTIKTFYFLFFLLGGLTLGSPRFHECTTTIASHPETTARTIMKSADFILLCGLFKDIFGAFVEGRPEPPSSPVFEVAGRDAVLQCDVHPPVSLSQVEMLAWHCGSGTDERTAYVHRRNEDMRNDIAKEYRGRTDIGQDGSLRLHGLRRSDTAECRCVVWRESKVEARVSLSVVQVQQLDMYITRTPANQLVFLCKTSVWNLRPNLQLLDGQRKPLPITRESSVTADELHSVQTRSSPQGAPVTNGTRICSVTLPEVNLEQEKIIFFNDDFRPEEDDEDAPCSTLRTVSIALAFLVLVQIVAMVMAFKLVCDKDLQITLAATFKNFIKVLGREGEIQEYSEHADLGQVETTGASQFTARKNKIHYDGGPESGLRVSEKLAENDLGALMLYRDRIISVGRKLHVHPALIAAIISKQSQAGQSLDATGFGIHDKNCYGLMQINKNYHVVKQGGSIVAHIEDGTTYLIHLMRTVKNQRTEWTGQQHLIGALVAYISGMEKVPQEFNDNLDCVTPTKDFSNDVIARAKWYAAEERFGG